MKSLSYVLGFFCGLLIVILGGLVLRHRLKRRLGVDARSYDERQQAVQGRAYRYAYFTTLGALLLGGMLDMVLGVQWADLFAFAIICLWLSLCVYALYCIFHDAYFTLRSKSGRWVVIFLAVGIINLVIGAVNLSVGGESMLTDGKLNYLCTNLVTGVSTLLLAAAVLVKLAMDRRGRDEE